MGNVCQNEREPKQDRIFSNRLNLADQTINSTQSNFYSNQELNPNAVFAIMDSERVEIFFSCRNLINMDYLSKSDPKVSLWEKVESGQWSQVGSTETIQDNLNPDFTKSFVIDYIFEVTQQFKVEVVDVDGPDKFDFIGSTEFELGELMGSKNNMLILNLIHKKEQGGSFKLGGKLVVRSEKLAQNNDFITLDFSGKNIKCDGGVFSSKGSPFLRFYKPINQKALHETLERAEGQNTNVQNIQEQWVKVYETEPHSNSTNMRFRPFKMTSSKLCNGDDFQDIKVELYNYYKSGNHVLEGELIFSLNAITSLGKKEFLFMDKNKQNQERGVQVLNNIKTEVNHSFIDYLRGGQNMSAIVCIDFTGSNGDPSMPNSQHRWSEVQHNEYQTCILSVMNILMNYDSDKKIPTYGFGALPLFDATQGLINTKSVVSHFFPCSGDFNNTEGHGVEGVFGLYKNAQNNCKLSGPTYFAPLLNEVLKFTKDGYGGDPFNYTTLLILTDGAIHDMQSTIDAIVELSKYPISIIIVGVGQANFDKMDSLDSDDELLRGNYGTAKRDIVQFVPFRNFKQNPAGQTQEVLRELPAQVTGFYKSVNIAPKAANVISNSTINEALGNNMNFTRTGNVMDQKYYTENPQSIATNQLNFGQLTQNANYPSQPNFNYPDQKGGN